MKTLLVLIFTIAIAGARLYKKEEVEENVIREDTIPEVQHQDDEIRISMKHGGEHEGVEHIENKDNDDQKDEKAEESRDISRKVENIIKFITKYYEKIFKNDVAKSDAKINKDEKPEVNIKSNMDGRKEMHSIDGNQQYFHHEGEYNELEREGGKREEEADNYADDGEYRTIDEPDDISDDKEDEESEIFTRSHDRPSHRKLANIKENYDEDESLGTVEPKSDIDIRKKRSRKEGKQATLNHKRTNREFELPAEREKESNVNEGHKLQEKVENIPENDEKDFEIVRRRHKKFPRKEFEKDNEKLNEKKNRKAADNKSRINKIKESMVKDEKKKYVKRRSENGEIKPEAEIEKEFGDDGKYGKLEKRNDISKNVKEDSETIAMYNGEFPRIDSANDDEKSYNDESYENVDNNLRVAEKKRIPTEDEEQEYPKTLADKEEMERKKEQNHNADQESTKVKKRDSIAENDAKLSKLLAQYYDKLHYNHLRRNNKKVNIDKGCEDVLGNSENVGKIQSPRRDYRRRIPFSQCRRFI